MNIVWVEFNGGVQKSNHLLPIFWRTVGSAHSHAAKSDGRYFEIPHSKFARLHCDYSQNPSLLFKDTECRFGSAFPILPILCLILPNVLILCTVSPGE